MSGTKSMSAALFGKGLLITQYIHLLFIGQQIFTNHILVFLEPKLNNFQVLVTWTYNSLRALKAVLYWVLVVSASDSAPKATALFHFCPWRHAIWSDWDAVIYSAPPALPAQCQGKDFSKIAGVLLLPLLLLCMVGSRINCICASI